MSYNRASRFPSLPTQLEPNPQQPLGLLGSMHGVRWKLLEGYSHLRSHFGACAYKGNAMTVDSFLLGGGDDYADERGYIFFTRVPYAPSAPRTYL